MNKYFFNHNPLLNLPVSINQIFIEILEISKTIKSWHSQLLFSDRLWEIQLPSTSKNLREYVHSLSDQDFTKLIVITALDLGPHFEDLDNDQNLSITPSIAEDNSYKLITSCYYDDQKNILSLDEETDLINNEYEVSYKGNSSIIKNVIGGVALETELKFGQNFRDIFEVFNKIESTYSNIVILEDAKKSARNHHFQNEYESVYKCIIGLNDVDLPLILDRISGEQRKELFYQEVGYEISEESTRTMKIQMCRSEREFLIPGKGREIFEWHIKIGKTRIHYYIDSIDRMIYIGHCGKHLKTSKKY